VALRRLLCLLAIAASWTIATGLLPGARAQTPTPQLEWGPCPAVAPMATPGAGVDDVTSDLECATLAVPLDYDDPGGDQITIGLNRLPARDRAKRIGNLIFNPGGPGGAATPIVAEQASGITVFTPAVLDHFDLIGMDPRGTGSSTPVRCDPDTWNGFVSQFPKDEAGFERLRTHIKAVGESCLQLTGPLLAHLDTVSAARDIEQVRLALGGEPLNYLGLSYGTQLGATYAELYPDNIRVMALDGALDHDQRGLAMLDNEARAYETELERFAEWCDQTETCALHGQDVLAIYDELVATADATPIPAAKCKTGGYCREEVTGEYIRFGVQELLLFKDPSAAFDLPGWEGLASALAEAQKGDASAFAPYLAHGEDSGAYAGLAIECVDWETPIANYDDIAAAELFARVVAPRSQGATQTWTLFTGCMGWPVPAANPPRLWDVEGTPPILIVNATYDPSTAYIWAQLMREQIDGSVLLTRIGDGHTLYLLPGESQTRDAIDHYLITGETPPPNTVYEN
jgi:pimeloyl-ACP methyl ester carboxylesterase